MLNLKNFKSIFKASPAPCLVFLPDSPDFTVIEGNDAFFQVSGIESDRLLNKPIAEAFPEIVASIGFQRSLKEVIANKKSKKLNSGNGTVPKPGVNWQDAALTPVLNKKGKIEYILYTIDINGKKFSEPEAPAENKLAMIQEHYRSLFEYNPNGVFSFDLEGNFLTANKSLATLVECSEEEILQKSFIHFIVPEDLDKVLSFFKKASEGEPQNYEVRAITAKSNERELNITNLPIIVHDEIIGIYGVARDITEKTKSEQLIRKREEQLQKIMDRSLDVICTLDEEGKFVKVGAASEKLWGYTAEELIGTRVIDLIHQDDVDLTRQSTTTIFSGAEVTNLKNRIIRKDGLSRVNIWSGRWDEEDRILYAVARDYAEMNAAEEKVKNNEKRFKALLTNSTDGLFLLAEDGTVIEASLTGSKILALNDDDILGRKWTEFIYSQDALVVKEAFLKSLITPDEADITEHRIQMPDGKIKWLKSTFHNQLNESAVGAVVLTFWDVTEKKSAELAIIESERVRKLIMDSALDAIVCTGLNGIITLWNAQAEKTFGWRREEVIGKPMEEYIIPPKYRERHHSGMLSYLQSGRGSIINKVVEITALNKQQKEFPVELTVIHIKEPGTNFLCAFIKDISERKEAEKSLQKSEERYHKMVEEVKDYAIVLLDKNGFVQNWNKGAENITGYTEEEILGQNFKIFYPEEERNGNLPEKLLKQAAENGVASIEGWRVRKNGSLFWANVILTALHDDDNTIIGFTKVTRDLTEKKKAEEELLKYAEELKASNEELEQFAYIASHDLQEPLRMVTSFLTQLEKKYNNKLDDKGKQYIFYAVDGAVRMRKIILDLLEYSRIGRMEYEVGEIDMNLLVKEVVELNRIIIQEKSAVIDWKNLPVIRGRKSPLQQVLHNLIGNALKYQEEDKNPRVKISATETSGFWQFAIADNGIGIEPQFYDKIFTIFQRLHNKTEYSGNGIGLAICKKIIENHKGKIWVEPNSENGSTFYFTISKQLK
jgi:PAS domain S-box-containing protein